MNRLQLLKIIKSLITIFIITMFIFACSQSREISNHKQYLSINDKADDINSNYNIDYKYYDIFDIAPAKIIIPKNQTNSQSLSVLVNDGNGNLIVFDGGRVEDADYLCDIIKDNGGNVKTWFITHIHDDHIGALYKILSDKRIDIVIERLYYDFASFDWYYSKMGNDAGIYYLFENAIKEYNSYFENSKNKIEIIEINDKSSDYLWTYPINFYSNDEKKYIDSVNCNMYVDVLNRHFELDQDPINNTSIVFVVQLSGKKILILGDLGYDGGTLLLNNSFKFKGDAFSDNSSFYNENHYIRYGHGNIGMPWKSFDIVVLSHHGQNGIDPELYKKFNPKVIVWPTSKDIYENTHGRYYTDDTKKALSEIDSIEYQIKSYEETAVIR